MTEFTETSVEELNAILHDATFDLDSLALDAGVLSLRGKLYARTPEVDYGIFGFRLTVREVGRYELGDQAQIGQLMFEELTMDADQILRIEGSGPVVLRLSVRKGLRLSIAVDERPLKVRKWLWLRQCAVEGEE